MSTEKPYPDPLVVVSVHDPAAPTVGFPTGTRDSSVYLNTLPIEFGFGRKRQCT
jgi:hypothetical protein